MFLSFLIRILAHKKHLYSLHPIKGMVSILVTPYMFCSPVSPLDMYTSADFRTSIYFHIKASVHNGNSWLLFG